MPWPDKPDKNTTRTPTMNLDGYIARVNEHLDRMGVPEVVRPNQDFYADAWNNQTPAHKLAMMIWRRREV